MIPLVSVIIPNYNHEFYLPKRIESILNQSFQDFEIIILDDFSTDNSRKLIEQYRNNKKVTHIIYNHINSGSTFKQWEKGIGLAKGEYIWIAESDDYCELNFLENLVKLLNSNDALVLCYSKSFRVDAHEKIIDDLSFWYKDLSLKRWQSNFINDGVKEIRKNLIYKNTIPNASAVLFCRKVSSCLDDEIINFKLCGDWLFWIKVLQMGKIGYTINTVNYFRTHENTVRNANNENNYYEKEREIIFEYLKNSKLITKSKIEKLQINIKHKRKSLSYSELKKILLKKIKNFSRIL